jgi:hypothetical protein
MAMEKPVEVEEDYFVKSKSRMLSKIEAVAIETFVHDRGDFLDSLADALDIDTDEQKLPKVEVEIIVHFGKEIIKISGFEKEEKEDDE